ncbi:MAG: leucine-rich repeat domain-containing protein, partial [Clostridia bacterium]|nr:leucine-rich repeat domain-containing protein [Clostridia bacterium]
NMGWTTKADYAHYPITKDYKFFTGAMVIDFNIEQKPGLNYAVTQDGKTKTYGYNDPSILTYTNEITSFTPADNFDGNLVICKDYVRIENAAFFGCTELKSVKFETGSRMQTIGGYAFQECTNLTNVVVPKSVTSMGWSVFVFCDKLYTIRCQSSGPNTDWDPTWNVKYIDYDAMFEDSMNGIQKDPSAYYTYFNVIWNYS